MSAITPPNAGDTPYPDIVLMDILLGDQHVLELLPVSYSFTLWWADRAATWRVALMDGITVPEGYHDACDLITRAVAQYNRQATLSTDPRSWPEIESSLYADKPDVIVLHAHHNWPHILRIMTRCRRLTDTFLIVGEPEGVNARMAQWFAGRYGYHCQRQGRLLALTHRVATS